MKIFAAKPLLLFLCFAALAGILSANLWRKIPFPFPPFNQLIFDVAEFDRTISYEKPVGSEGGWRDLGGLMLGMRRLTADVAWIAVLQYYGSHEFGQDEGGAGAHPALKKLVLRTLRFDPSFNFAALYGSGSLAFNLNRPKEALEILEEAIRYNPTFWRYRLYVGAILYKQKGRYDEMIGLLEDAARYPDCPVLVKSVLANLHKERGRYARALEIWIEVAQTKNLDPWYREESERQIVELKEKLGLR